ncbi:hypothetical protein KSC_030730 [Ktedonobacter sp. SOSP1-52]|uniref:hypothetical protein n=1 Tax=Ktedonobacter sp. SOSP1-52 TaxID=2778366 RepID=UPI001916BA22|nr:hypothetical protein [Ktedonobacter sp. SOSP1-52]GHO64181.1 hypothetical protein KSC_030730 [Ktedonobacter sp. SOSP1-52]
MSAEIESRASSWSWCSTCDCMMPLIHTCSQGTPSINDPQLTEDVDYSSVEAYLRGRYGRAGQARAQQAINKGLVQANQTKTTRMQWWMH